MYRLRVHSAIVAAAALATLVSPVPVAAISSDIEVTVRAQGAGPYLPGLPLLLVVGVRNTGTAEVTIPEPTQSGRDNPYNSLDILTGHEDAALTRVDNVAPELGPWKSGIPPVPPAPIALQPDELREVQVVLSYDWLPERESLLVAPGTLRVQAALCDYGPDAVGNPGIDRGNCVYSNVLEFAIAKPEGEAAEAWGRVKASERPWLLAHPAAVEHVTQETDFRRFQEIGGMNAGEYSRHAAALVAYMFAQGNALDLHPGRPPQPLVAKQWLDKAMSEKDAADIPPDWKRLAEKLEKAGAIP